MLEPLRTVAIVACIVAVAALIAGFIDEWLKYRNQARLDKIEEDLARAQQRLQALALRHEAWLHEQAHEARKALIMESFIASHEAQEARTSEHRSQKHNSILRHP